MLGAHVTPVCFQVGLSSCKTSSRSSVTTKTGLGASHQINSSLPETTTVMQSDVRGGFSTPWEGAKNASMERTHTPVCFQVGLSS